MLRATDFTGDWRLERVLTDHRGAMSGTLEGIASLQAQSDHVLAYDEQGTLCLQSGAQLQAERRYQWQWSDKGVFVSFADGSPFHHFTPSGQVRGTQHLCGDDLYDVTYDFTNWPRWVATWTAKGPKKDYTSRSVYSRG